MRWQVVVSIACAACGVASSARAATLEEVWTAAEAHSFELRLAREQTNQAATFRWQALSQQLPQLSTQWTYTHNQFEVEIPDDLRNCILIDPLGDDSFLPISPEDCFGEEAGAAPVLLQTKDALEGSIRLVQPLLRANAAPGWRSATRVWRAAEADEARARQQIRVATARVYYGLLTARLAEEVADASVAIAKAQRDVVSTQVEVGAVQRRVGLQADLALSRAERDVMSSREQLVQAEQAFERVTGLSAPDTLEIPEPQVLGDDVEQALKDAESRADVRAATLRHEAAKDERLARDLEWMPTIDLAFLQQVNALPTALNPNPYQWRVAVQLNWSIFDGGLRMARSKELASRTRAASILVEQRAQRATEEVKVAWERLARATRAFEAVELEVALAEESLELAQASFQAGGATWIEVEQAQLALSSSRLAWATERMNRDLAYFDVQLARGRM